VQFQTSVEIDAPPARVWAVLSDVERWPDWTASMTRVELTDGGALARGSTVRIKQPRFPAMTWRVTSLEPNEGFTWEVRTPGGYSVAGHRIEPRGDRGSRVTLTVRQTGALMTIIAPLMAGTTRHYMEMEAAGLKAACEGATRA
jgi:uncharacterized protein YndB with AHSA1/START domain